MKLGAEPKKIVILGGLVAVAAVVLYTNSSTDDPRRTAAPRPAPAAPARSTAVTPSPAAILERPVAERPLRASSDRGSGEFRPSLRPRRGEERPDPATIDPTLRLDLLAKLQNAKIEGGDRSLFEFSQPKPPKAPDVKIQPKPGAGKKPETDATKKTEEAKPAAPPKPQPPPILLKFYGYISPVRQGVKRAFFLDGEEIIVAGEGELIKRRYKVVRIGVNSVVVEDTEHKHQQTLALEERAG